MAMPSLVYRTNEITKRVIASNHEIQKPKQEVSHKTDTSEEPEWMVKSNNCIYYWELVKEEKKEREMIAKGFKRYVYSWKVYDRDDHGNWIRDEMVEFDSDEEPTL